MGLGFRTPSFLTLTLLIAFFLAIRFWFITYFARIRVCDFKALGQLFIFGHYFFAEPEIFCYLISLLTSEYKTQEGG